MITTRAQREAVKPDASKPLNATRPPNPGMFRQGDVLLVSVARIPRAAKVRPDGVVAASPVTGHAHRAPAPAVLLEHRGRQFVRVPAGGAALVHDEHAAISLPVGLFRVVHQREYTPRSANEVLRARD